MVGYEESWGEKWLARTVQSMYTNAKSSVQVNSQYSPWFDVQVGVHQGSVLSPLLFIIIMQALSCHFQTGCPWELLYMDNLVIIAETLDELLSLENQLRNKRSVGKTKIMVSAHTVPRPVAVSKFPCGVCSNSVVFVVFRCTNAVQTSMVL